MWNQYLGKETPVNGSGSLMYTAGGKTPCLSEAGEELLVNIKGLDDAGAGIDVARDIPKEGVKFKRRLRQAQAFQNPDILDAPLKFQYAEQYGQPFKYRGQTHCAKDLCDDRDGIETYIGANNPFDQSVTHTLYTGTMATLMRQRWDSLPP